MKYTLSLALLDYLPVILTAIGLIVIVRMVAHINATQGKVAMIGTVLTAGGGAFRATWKLLMAASNGTRDIFWLEDGLFVLMAPGYTLLAWSVWQTVRIAQGKRSLHAWYPPFVVIVVMFSISVFLFITQPDSPAWERVLLSIMVLATLITGIFLILFAFRQKLRAAGWLFILNLAGIFILNGLARIGDQTIPLQWIEEGVNTISWLAFAIAANQVYLNTRINFGVDPENIKAIIAT